MKHESGQQVNIWGKSPRSLFKVDCAGRQAQASFEEWRKEQRGWSMVVLGECGLK